MYEMSTGYDLSTLLPLDSDYARVADAWCRDVLRYIFKRNKNGHFRHNIMKVKLSGRESVLTDLYFISTLFSSDQKEKILCQVVTMA